MELDDLKKSWNALDEHLKNKEFIEEKEIAQLLGRARNKMNSIDRFNRKLRFASIGILTLAVLFWICADTLTDLFYWIALNTCISFIRKEKNVPEIVALTREADWMTEEKDELTEMLRQLYRMINQLGQLDKSIVLLYLEEKSYEEIAEITGLTVTNVATKLSRIKDKLKKMKKEE